MAMECLDVIGAINLLMERLPNPSNNPRFDETIAAAFLSALDASLFSNDSRERPLQDLSNQLGNARKYLEHVAVFLADLEKSCPENGISTQLRPLFIEAHNGFCKVLHYMDTEGGSLKLFKPPPEKLISEVLKIIKLENITDQLRASRSSSQITTDMVCFVEALLDCTASCLDLVHSMQVDGVIPPACALKKKLRFLRIFFTLVAKWCIEHGSMKNYFNHVKDVAYKAAHLSFLGFANNMDSEYSKLLEELNAFKLRPVYLHALIGLKSPISEASMNPQDMLTFVSYLQEDLKKLLNRHANLKVAFESLNQALHDLSGFMQIIGEDCFGLRELVSLRLQMEALAIEAAILIYYGEETDIPLHLKLAFSNVRLMVNLVKILKRSKAPLGDLINYVMGELIFLGSFLVDALKHYEEQTKFNNCLMVIQSVTWQAYSDIDSHSVDKVMARKISCLHFQLLLKFNFIKAAIRQMRPNFSASSTLDHSTINFLGFLPINFEVIDSYFSMLTPSSDSPNMDESLMGFHEHILDYLLLEYKSNVTFIVADEVKKFHDGLFLLATYFFNEAYEDAEDRNKSRNFNLVFKFLTEAFKLVKYDVRSMDLPMDKATLKADIPDMIKRAHEELILLVAFLMDVLRGHIELNKWNDILVRAEVTAEMLTQISGSCYENLMDACNAEKLRLSLYDYLQEIELVKVEARKVCFPLQDASPCSMTGGDDLIKLLSSHQDWLLNCGSCQLSILKNQIPVIKDKLVHMGSFLADIVQYRDMHQELKDLMKCARHRKYICLFPILGCRPTWYDILYLSDIKQFLKFVEDKVKSICLEVPDSSVYRFPKTSGLGFLNCFSGKLEDLLNSELHSIIDLKHQIKSVKEGLLCLKSSVDHLAESYEENDETCCLITSVTEMAYKAEYIIDSCLTCSHPQWYKVLRIFEVVENIKRLNEVVSDSFGREKIDARVQKAANTFTVDAPSSSGGTPRENEEMEGFEEAMDKIKEQLLGGSSQLDIISIVGMPGIGKTTLAEKIYNDLIATTHFDVHAKCRVSQSYSWKELLLTILSDVLGSTDRTKKEDSELANELRQVLLTKRFLILIDDVWDTTIWDYLHMCFQGSQNRSRIILTTRLGEIANYAKSENNPHHLRLFRDDESWRLLQELVFQGDSCPPDLVDVGIRIAKSCGGLPLFIALVSGVLKKKRKNTDTWKKVEESVVSHNIGSLEESMSLIGFSYKNLPHHLRPCFLYFGGFLKGKDIHVSKLARLWQVEGFVQANKQKGTEDAAQDLLEDLISRNLVMAVEKRPNEKVKRCHIHDLLHNFCLEKSKQENFLSQITREEDMLPKKPKNYRLFIHSSQDEIELWRPCRSNVRSLHVKVTDQDNLLLPRDTSYIFDIFKLVEVLDLESFNIGNSFPSEVQSLTYLRYFAVQTGANSIPSFIAKLQNLETFVVRGLRGVVVLPCALLKMVKLRHILVKDYALFNLDESMGEVLANYQLDNLEAFSNPCLSYNKDVEMILKRMPNLRKLSCIFSGRIGNCKKGNGRFVVFPKLEFLSHLESLKLVSESFIAKLPHKFYFPSKLKELTLSKFRLPWSEISIIGELPNLEILRLVFRAFEGDHWEVNDSEFPELKYLKLDNINIIQWSVSDDAFPKLERLVLTKCNRLEEVPSHFGDATSLKSIEVNWCGGFVAASALEIETMQREDYGNDAFTVAIQPPVWTVESTP